MVIFKCWYASRSWKPFHGHSFVQKLSLVCYFRGSVRRARYYGSHSSWGSRRSSRSHRHSESEPPPPTPASSSAQAEEQGKDDEWHYFQDSDGKCWYVLFLIGWQAPLRSGEDVSLDRERGTWIGKSGSPVAILRHCPWHIVALLIWLNSIWES